MITVFVSPNLAMAGRLSVREVENLVRKYTANNAKSKTAIRSKLPHIIELEQKLTNLLGTKVSIDTHKNGQRGKIVVEFYSLDDFDRITDQLGLAELENV